MAKTAATTAVQHDFTKILLPSDRFGTGAGTDLESRLNNSFDLLLIRSGLEIGPSMFLLLTVCSAITFCGAAFVFKENILVTALGIAVGALIPLLWAIVAQSQRIRKMTHQLPEMIDELARAARTGRSVEQCFQLVAHDTPAPLGTELQRCAGKVELGMGLGRALADLPERTGIVSLRIFVMALSVHASAGGDLIHVLERLAQTIRGRIAFLARLRASTAASRATTILMLVIPPLVLGFFLMRDPDYFQRLFAVKWGRNVTLIAAALQIVGIVWVTRIMKQSQKS